MNSFSCLTLLLSLVVSIFSPVGEAQALSSNLLCQFNKGKLIAASQVDNGGAFVLKWSDGPKQSYVWVGSNSDMHNLTDSLGGRWHYMDHRNGKGFTLLNLENSNLIECD
jgi:hypothetical protein